MEERDERLVRVETKLDGIANTLDVRLTHNERRISDVETDLADHARLEQANRNAGEAALKHLIDQKASKEEVAVVSDVAKASRDAIAKIGWAVMLAVVAAVMTLVLGGRVG